jgi:hypothetical protein
MECRYCGRPTDIIFEGVPICEQCYQDAGSCCLEFGSHDLWQRPVEKSAAGDCASAAGKKCADRAAADRGACAEGASVSE